jgi:hypothetical protein
MKQAKLCLLSDKVHEIVSESKKSFLGRVLTVIDSAISDPQQRKATKDLVNDAFYGHDYFRDDISRNFKNYAEATGTEYYKELPVNNAGLEPYNQYKD